AARGRRGGADRGTAAADAENASGRGGEPVLRRLRGPEPGAGAEVGGRRGTGGGLGAAPAAVVAELRLDPGRVLQRRPRDPRGAGGGRPRVDERGLLPPRQATRLRAAAGGRLHGADVEPPAGR